MLHAEINGILGKRMIVLFTSEPFFLGCGNNFAVSNQASGAVMADYFAMVWPGFFTAMSL
jgi:hypothetical protein